MENNTLKSNIFVDAYLDNNLGDDLMVIGLLKKYPNHNFFLRTNNSVVKNTFSSYKNVSFLSSKEFVNNIEKEDLYIRIGGSIFIFNSLFTTVMRLFKIREWKKIKKKSKKMAILGSNLGPFKVKFSKFIAKYEIGLFDLITVRDEYSYNLITEKFRLNNAKMYDDIVFELVDSNENVKKENIIGISAYRSVLHPEHNQKTYETQAKLIDSFLQKRKCSVKIFAFDSEKENDLSAAFHLQYILQNKYRINSEIIPYLGYNVDTFLKHFSTLSYMLALRFHSAILCDIYNVQYFPISYSNKMSNYVLDSNPKITTYTIGKDFYDLRSLDDEMFGNRMKEIKKGHLEELDKLIEN